MTTSEQTADRPAGRPLSPVVACTLSRGDLASQATRWKGLRAAAARARVETDSGIRVTFRNDRGVEDELRALAAVENDCCSWARWDVRREHGELVLDVSSTGEGISTLHTMFLDH